MYFNVNLHTLCVDNQILDAYLYLYIVRLSAGSVSLDTYDDFYIAYILNLIPTYFS